MKLRKPNKTTPVVNSQEDDKVVVDGFLTPGEIVERGRLAAQSTIETLKLMYPHSPAQEIKEREYIANEELTKTLRALEQENKEGISAYYQKHKIKQKIKDINNELIRLNEEYKENQRINTIYQKERKIAELEQIVQDLKNR